MITRQLAPHIKRLAEQYPVVTLTGPRQAGKTTLCKQTFPDYLYVNLEDPTIRLEASTDAKGFLKSFNKGVILDEIQNVPDLPSYIQVIVDEKNTKGQFILTGSQQFEVTRVTNQSLAGRTALIKLLPFSLEELYSGSVNQSLYEIMYRGFYPRIINDNLDPKEAYPFYISTYVERDIRDLVNIKDITNFQRFLIVCASNAGQLLNYTSISNDCGIDQKTVKNWLSLLEASYICFRIMPHANSFRKRVNKSPKLYFYDVGLLCSFLGISKAEQLEKHPLRGHIFENFVIVELVKQRFNSVQNSNLFFFRDHSGNEVDVIAEYSDRICPIEIKTSATINEEFFKGLDYYCKLNPRAKHGFLVYGGDENKKIKEHQIISWKSVGSLLDKIEQHL